jgi:hypothetical protein
MRSKIAEAVSDVLQMIDNTALIEGLKYHLSLHRKPRSEPFITTIQWPFVLRPLRAKIRSHVVGSRSAG